MALRKYNTDNRGQTLVEYILLLSVLISVSYAIFKSPLLSQYLGQNSRVFESMRQQMEYSYRNALPGIGPIYQGPYPDGYMHPSFVGNEYTRFFGPVAEYP